MTAASSSSAQGRNIASGHNTNFIEMAAALLPKYGDDYPIPRKKLPKALLWFFGPIINKVMTRKYVSRNVGYPWIGDNRKSIKELGAQYRPLPETMNDMFQRLIDVGRLKAK